MANRLTGISTPFGGVSWNQSPLESVLDIRRTLTAEAGQLPADSHLRASLTAMSAACRKFLDQIQELRGQRGGRDVQDIALIGRLVGIDEWQFLTWLGELRGVFGIHIALISGRYHIDVDEGLSSILPAENI